MIPVQSSNKQKTFFEMEEGVFSWFMNLVFSLDFCVYFLKIFRFFTLIQTGLNNGHRYFSIDSGTMHFSYQELPLFFS